MKHEYTGRGDPPQWTVSETYNVGTRQVKAGDTVKIKGEGGAEFIFVRHVVNTPEDRRRKPREWIDVVGGARGVTMCRSFDPARITKIKAANR